MELVIDNNVLFSIMNPNSVASYLFFSLKSKFLAPKFIKSEFSKYKKVCLKKSKLSEQEFEMRQAEVEETIRFFDFKEYKICIPKALKFMSDPNDVDFLALALSSNAIIWSNDLHFQKQTLVKVYTTKEIIELLIKREI